MTKPGHEVPHFDKTNPTDISSHAGEDQLRFGEEPPEPEPTEPEAPPGLKLTEDEEAKVDNLMEATGFDHGTAVLQKVSREKARRIIGHHHSTSQTARIETSIQERRASQTDRSPTTDKVVQLLKETSSDTADSAPGSSEEDLKRATSRMTKRSLHDLSERD